MNDLLQQLDETIASTIDSSISRFAAVDLVFIGVGLLLLLFGRRLYWLALAALGFAVAVHLSDQFLLFDNAQQRVIVGVVLGLLGGLLAVIAQRMAVRIAGFVLGGWGTFFVARILWPGEDQLLLPIALAAAGALLGVLFASKLFDLALVLVTSSVGAVLIAQHLLVAGSVQAVVWLVLTLFGVAVQLRRGKSKQRRLRPDND